MANKITTLTSGSDNLYPRTKASAVSDNDGNSLENLLLYQGDGIEELTDPTIIASLVETSTMSNNGYFIYDDGSNVYKMKGSTLKAAVQPTLYYQAYNFAVGSSSPYAWSGNIKKDGYTVIGFHVDHGWSGSIIGGSEQYNQSTGSIAGYASGYNSGLAMCVRVWYIKNL